MKRLFKILSLFIILFTFGCSLRLTSEKLSKTKCDITSINKTIKSSTLYSSVIEKKSSTTRSITTRTSASTTTTKTSAKTTTINKTTTSSKATTTTKISSYSIKDIKSLGASLNDDEYGIDVIFSGKYVKAITDNNDKLMLFIDEDDYILVRVVGGFNDYLKNRYLNCEYKVKGTISKKNNQVEIKYISLENITSTPEIIDFNKYAKELESISNIIPELNNITLNNKGNGTGIIVKVKGVIESTDRSDSNTKASIFDGVNCITLIGDKKIADGISDINKSIEVIGILNILKGAPAILVLNIKYIDNLEISYENIVDVTPSYFSKWYHTSKYVSDPTYQDYMTLYRITGYVADDESRTTAYYLGLTDTNGDSLSDISITKSIKGIYLINHQGLDERDLSYSIYTEYTDKLISVYASIHQFDTNNHAWKMFTNETSIEVIE